MRIAMAFTALALILASCAAPSMPNPSPTSAQTPTPSNTAEPALSATLAPSTTPQATLSPGPAPSASISSAPALTPTESQALDCSVLMQSVKNGTHFKPRELFSINWKVRNTGASGWDPSTVGLTYIAGTKMYQYPVIQLQGGVDPGNVAYLIADMRAPKNSGKYSMTWSLRQGDIYFCHMSLTIYVD